VRRWVLTLVVLASGVVAAIAFAHVPTNPSQARRVAQRILANAQLPPGAQKSVSDPSGSKLGRPGSYPATPDLVDVHRFWRVPGDVQSVFDWIESHPPAGSSGQQGAGTGNSNGIVSQYVGFSLLGPGSGGAPSEVLMYTGAPARGGGTALRVDAQVVWLFKRPASERIPAGVDQLAVSDRHSDGTTSRWSIDDSARIRHAVSIINALPAGQPGARHCPADRGPYVTLAFARRGVRLATADVDGGGCESVIMFIHGHRQHPLQGNPELIDKLSSALGVEL
jgi:hypothetical protein